ncbi:hypothetical protein IFM89_023418 [Coptis chinensis]|uniref:Uncharacterized protein n=1 Tax=Coptis chinensis TaxID=261450 RepID=A0A835GYS2_9MAGN|nr:hypothetical protein IFM89_023418 [Coptis chinensis]
MSHQHISIKTGDLLISLVHARSAYVQRRALWDELSQLGLNVEAWAVAGDFNVVTSNEERKGGRLPCRIAVNEFVEFINGNALIDTTSLGFKFSWSNKRHEDKRMVQKIDRILVNQKWIDAATGWRSKILQRRISDHSPIVGWFTAIPKPHNIPFRFKKHWIKHESLKEVVKQSWEERLEDAPIRKVMKKLKRLKEVLKAWSWDTFGDLSKKKKRVTEDLERIMKEQEEDPFNVQLQERERNKEEELNGILDTEAAQWRQKARVSEAFEGDRNTAYFHALHKLRMNKALILEIQKGDGTILKQQQDIKQHIVSVFEAKYKPQAVIPNVGLMELIPKLVTDEENANLSEIPTITEIKHAVFNMDANSSPGPDGFQGAFYQTFWDIVGLDVSKAIISFFKDNKLPQGMNSNFLVLLPKEGLAPRAFV